MVGRMVPMTVLEPGRDPFDQLVEGIERHLNERGWGQPPRLFLIHVDPCGDGHRAFGVSHMPFHDDLARALHPVQFLDIVTEVINDLPLAEFGSLLDDFIGAALAVEAWMLEVIKDDLGSLREAVEVAQRGEIHAHADRVEGRQVLLVVPPITTRAAVRPRGQEVSIVADFGGQVADALRRFALAIYLKRLGLPRQPRRPGEPNYGGMKDNP